MVETESPETSSLKFTIVGGGISGFLAAQALDQAGIDFEILEASDRLGGSFAFGALRFQTGHGLKWLQDSLPHVSWVTVTEKAAERRKGNWEEPKILNRDASELHSFWLKPYLAVPGFEPEATPDSILKNLVDKFAERKVRLRTQVQQVNPSRKVLVTSDGEDISYEKLVWAAPLKTLSKSYLGIPTKRSAGWMKKGGLEQGGFVFDHQLPASTLDKKTVVFPFRFKAETFTALGLGLGRTVCAPERSTWRWILLVEDSMAEDKEELAKCFRAFKRELSKEFPEIPTASETERIIYLPPSPSGEPRFVDSLWLYDDVLYVGPDVGLITEKGNESPDLHRSAIDRIATNCASLSGSLSGLFSAFLPTPLSAKAPQIDPEQHSSR